MSGVSKRAPPARRVGIACGSCKKSKGKCSGPPAPCTPCTRKGRECVFEVTLDGRRKEAARAALDAIQAKHAALESLFNCLQNGDDDAVFSLVNAIRKGSALSELQKVVEERQETASCAKPNDSDMKEEAVAGPSRQDGNTVDTDIQFTLQ